MEMNEKQARIQHFLANVFTALNFELLETSLPPEEKEKLLHLVRQASLVTTHNELFLGEAPEFVRQEIVLNNIIDVAIVMQQRVIEEKKKKIKHLEEKVTIVADRFYFDEALKELATYIISKSDSVEFKWDKEDKSLTIKFDADIKLSQPIGDLLELLHRTHLYDDELKYQFALKILETHGERIKIAKGTFKIFL